MVDNIRIGADAHAGHVLDLARMEEAEGDLSDTVEIAPDLVLRADPALGMAGRWRSPHGEVLHLDASPVGAGAWFALHLALRVDDLSRIGAFGLALRARAAQPHRLRIALRSGQEGGFADAFFDKPLLLRPAESAHVDVMTPRLRAEVPVAAPWRELVIFLPLEEAKVEIADLRVFAV